MIIAKSHIGSGCSRHAVAAEAAHSHAHVLSISIIVAVLNEIGLIRHSLRQLRKRAPNAELIVVDGGSIDGTREAAAPLCDRLVLSERGRARQLNAGAKAAHGEVLWFLHADAEVPEGCLDRIQEVLADAAVAGGYFRIRIPRATPIYRMTDSFAHYAGHVLRMRCGDHGLFCRAEAFDSVGGFSEVPLMEDAEFFRALHRAGRVRHTEARLTVSPRRFEKVGPVRVTLSYGLIATLYAVGVPISALARLYSLTCTRKADD